MNSLRFDNTRYERISEQHKGSLEWLWEHEKYLAWSSTASSDLLLIEGKPGSGKSTLMKYFQRSLSEREPRERQIVASFYYSYREGERQTNHSNMLRSVLHDVLDQNEEFFFHFQRSYRQAAKRGGQPQWSYDSLKKVLLSFPKNHPVKERLYLIVDAVDESDDAERYDIIELLRDLCSTKGPCIVKVFAASRPVVGLSGSSAMNIKTIRLQDVNHSDIVGFVESFLGPELDLQQDVARRATDYIVQNSQGVFAWVRLVREELLKCARSGYTRTQSFAYLESLPTELEGFLLVDRGTDNEAKDKEEQRALHHAAANRHSPVVGLLIDQGADREANDNKEQRALHIAAANGQNRVVGLLTNRSKSGDGYQASPEAKEHAGEDTSLSISDEEPDKSDREADVSDSGSILSGEGSSVAGQIRPELGGEGKPLDSSVGEEGLLAEPEPGKESKKPYCHPSAADESLEPDGKHPIKAVEGNNVREIGRALRKPELVNTITAAPQVCTDAWPALFANGKTDVHFDDRNPQSRSNDIRGWIEKKIGARVNWWSLSARRDKLRDGFWRVTWKCVSWAFPQNGEMSH